MMRAYCGTQPSPTPAEAGGSGLPNVRKPATATRDGRKGRGKSK